jgi:hypothetical protein
MNVMGITSNLNYLYFFCFFATLNYRAVIMKEPCG